MSWDLQGQLVSPTAASLATPRNIAGHAFDGTADIDIAAADVGALAVFNVASYGTVGNGIADDTNAVKAAVAAAQTAGGGTVFFPPGNYKLTDRISLTAAPPLRFVGSGAAMNDQGTANATILTASGSSVFFFSHTAGLVSGTEVGNLSIVYSGTGHVFDDVNLQSGYFHDLNISTSNAGSAAFFTSTAETANNSVIHCTFERITITTTAATRTVPMVSFTSQNSGGISDVTFTKCKFNNTGGDHAQPAVLISCTATQGYHYATTFRDCYFEKPLGGAIRSLSGTGLLVESCMFWDMHGLTLGASSVYVGAGSGGVGSQGARILGCGRNRSAHNGTTTWDVECEATTSQVQVEGFHVLADAATTQTNAFFNFHGCHDVMLANNVSPQGASVNGDSTTVVTNPSPTQVTIASGSIDADLVRKPNLPYLDVRDYGAIGDGATDASTAIQNAIDDAAAAGGGTVWLAQGTYLIGTTLAITGATNVILAGSGTLLNNVSNAPMVRVLNCTYCGATETLQWLGQWKTGSSALELDGSLYGDFTVRGDEWQTGIRIVTSASATQNSAYNDLAMDIANGVTGMFFEGGNGRFASNNRISRITWGAAGSGSPVGINFSQDTDSNHLRWGTIDLNAAGSIAVLYNSADPANDVQVYENDLEYLIVQAHTTGTTALKANKTTGPGRTSFARLRLGGEDIAGLDISVDADIQLYNTTDGSTYTGKWFSGDYGDLTNKPAIPSTAADVGAVPIVRTVAGHPLSADVTLAKGDVGLGSVDNTADAAKAVLSATKLTTARTINGVSFDGTAAITVADTTKVPTSRSITAGTGLSGGGDLTADRTLTVAYGTSAGMALQGNTRGAASGVASLDAGTHHPLAEIPAGATLTVAKDSATGFWPASYDATTGAPVYTGGSASAGVRPTARADVVVWWKGPDPSPAIVSTGTAGMRNGIDMRAVTS